MSFNGKEKEKNVISLQFVTILTVDPGADVKDEDT